MQHAALTVDPAFRIGEVDPRLYGSFVEHMGRCVYTGIYEPGHPSADGEGFRGDVSELVTEIAPPVLRYPGGNFVSGYRWEDGIGPRENRPTRLDLAWRSLETNQVGVDEFTKWARRTGSEPMMAVNLGTRGIDAARNLLEYTNHPGGTYWSDLRRANGTPKPHDIKLWCLGNELDGPWQIGHKTALEYGRLAAETAKAMRRVDPTIELVACGSSHQKMPTFGTWEATVLTETYDLVDHISLHSYYDPLPEDRASFLASGVNLERMVEAVVATADHVRAVGRHRKRINLSFDEWNVWYQSRFGGEASLDWAEHPRLIEDEYSVVDAVVVGSLLISLLRHADRVRIACMAQLVNVIGPIRSEPGGPAWRQTIFHPYALMSRHGRGQVLRIEPTGPVGDTEAFGDVPLLDATAVHDEESGAVTVFAVNRDQHAPLVLDLDLRAVPDLVAGEHTALFDEDPEATNNAERPDRVTPRTLPRVRVADGRVSVELPALSWNMIRLR
ncbi:alpha-L-arabinofuranosidase [Actinophytocola xinjiangensis]|uniref:non-reducing end alpha-L-arabinofuranosidase n=1 Tax=Actinophytocola xinjiangensis TaxID=485602 RepID=A0A7Z1ATH0_9PSEU|nr:alpha-N-arabinofuranosidase [Actinophytocola xinjiangensis]OLF04824.1 alpha-L-arabinofuranosidase [Actinophytocola xinjiangensis]